MKNRSLDMRLVPRRVTESSSAWSVLSTVETARFCGQIMEAGSTSTSRTNPDSAKPMSWGAQTDRNPYRKDRLSSQKRAKSCARRMESEYEGLSPVVAATSTTVCSLMFHGPGLNDHVYDLLVRFPPLPLRRRVDETGTTEWAGSTREGCREDEPESE